MVGSSAASVRVGALCLSLIGVPIGGASASDPAAIAGLSGRWAGEGTLVPNRGPSEIFKCVITYFLSDDASRVRQNLRCHGDSYKFDAATKLQIVGGQVTGQWSDNVNSLTGSVSGSVTDKGFDIRLSGQFFAGTMSVVSSGCEQSVKVVPDRPDHMRELAAVLKKC
jgi:hypothetical protein